MKIIIEIEYENPTPLNVVSAVMDTLEAPIDQLVELNCDVTLKLDDVVYKDFEYYDETEGEPPAIAEVQQ